MTKFKNLKTGVVWEIDDPDMISRLENNLDYTEIKKSKTQKAKKS